MDCVVHGVTRGQTRLRHFHMQNMVGSQVALVVKNPAANAGDEGHRSSIPGSGGSSGEGNGSPFQYSCLGNPTEKESWATVHGVVKTRIRLRDSTTATTMGDPILLQISSQYQMSNTWVTSFYNSLLPVLVLVECAQVLIICHSDFTLLYISEQLTFKRGAFFMIFYYNSPFTNKYGKGQSTITLRFFSNNTKSLIK